MSTQAVADIGLIGLAVMVSVFHSFFGRHTNGTLRVWLRLCVFGVCTEFVAIVKWRRQHRYYYRLNVTKVGRGPKPPLTHVSWL
ncbi:hypothetical protein K450DRAFT_241370 [Umbelopsis ramanniana AG]|uniref:Uncharacterized protein n=1 Tax=Umbelopsis ramanniana AG TaxID=1314678 RepID=A0AAD5EC57_UMBRA|nr:uncharacterized protein K450DRAFT_241370 [Umbelopsis ramanniana AG]KAI8579520.1 hypothetical protein K450DRAFT_241370 [Umbelopsis ramanniana AG]